MMSNCSLEALLCSLMSLEAISLFNVLYRFLWMHSWDLHGGIFAVQGRGECVLPVMVSCCANTSEQAAMETNILKDYLAQFLGVVHTRKGKKQSPIS